MPRKHRADIPITAITFSHTFLSDGKISRVDIERLINLTDSGALRWYDSQSALAMNGRPANTIAWDDQAASEAIIGRNLRGVRIGYNPAGVWHYIRLTDHLQEHYYIEIPAFGKNRMMLPDRREPRDKSNSNAVKLIELVNQLYIRALLQVAQELNVPEAYGLVINKYA